MSENEVNLLLKTIQIYGGEYALTHKCFIKTFPFTGMKRQEVLALDWEDIDFKSSVIKIRKGKGKKERIVPISDTLNSDLWAYLQTRLPLITQAVFISQARNRLTPSPSSVIFRNYLKKAGLNRRFIPYIS